MLWGNASGDHELIFAASARVVAVAWAHWHAPLKTRDTTYIACHVRCSRIVEERRVEEMFG